MNILKYEFFYFPHLSFNISSLSTLFSNFQPIHANSKKNSLGFREKYLCCCFVEGKFPSYPNKQQPPPPHPTPLPPSPRSTLLTEKGNWPLMRSALICLILSTNSTWKYMKINRGEFVCGHCSKIVFLAVQAFVVGYFTANFPLKISLVPLLFKERPLLCTKYHWFFIERKVPQNEPPYQPSPPNRISKRSLTTVVYTCRSPLFS